MKAQTRNAIVAVGSAVALVGVILAFVLINPGIFQPPPPGYGLEPGQLAPQFVIPDVNGTAWNLSNHRGEVVLLDFMGSYCGPCTLEMQDGTMQDLYDNHSSQGFTILSIDVGGVSGTEDPAVAWRFIHGLNTDGTSRWAPGTWSVALDNQGLVTTYRVGPIPMKYLVDRSGAIVWKHVGYASPTELREQVLPLL